MDYRFATLADAGLLAEMNHRLIRDEGHRNAMSVAELQTRMEGWLVDNHHAVLFEDARGPAGYVLFRRQKDHIYLGQFFVQPACRRQGVGRAAIAWLLENAWRGAPRIRLDVLVGNASGIGFWRAMGFSDYCTTMERDT